MYSAYKRIVSFFPNTTWRRRASPGRRSSSCSSRSATSCPSRSSGSRTCRRQRRLGLRPHAPQAGLRTAAVGRLQARRRALMLPNGKPLTIEFLDFSSALQPHTMPFIQNLGKLGIHANIAHRRCRPVQEPHRRLRLRRRHCGERRLDDAGRGSAHRFHLAGRGAERVAQSGGNIRSRRRRAGRDDRRREKPQGSQRCVPGARSRLACRALLGADVVSRHCLGRLLGRLLAARAAAEARRRRARHLVVGPDEGEGDWAVTRGWAWATGKSPSPRSAREGRAEARRAFARKAQSLILIEADCLLRAV